MYKNILDKISLDEKSLNTSQSGKVERVSNKDVAIIGLSVNFPMAGDIETYWNNIVHSVDCISQFPEERAALVQSYVKKTGNTEKFQAGGYLRDISSFDSTFFRILPQEANFMDPHQKLFLQTAYSAIEDAGYANGKLKGTKTGIFVGFRNDEVNDYKQMLHKFGLTTDSSAVSGNLTSVLASRISYILDLKGPSMCIDTACSSAFTAIHQACLAMRAGDCDLSLVGAVKLKLVPFDENNILGVEAFDNRVKAFDNDADGTLWGEGSAAIVLKPLSKAMFDHDMIYAVIKGSAVNQDGTSVGITAPNVNAQTDVIVNAWKNAGISPDTVTYIEAHGTGTDLGDSIEIEGINEAFRKYTDKKQFCAISSVKTNMGHMDCVAGMGGLMKAIQALRLKQQPPGIHFKNPSRKIDYGNSAVYINTRTRNWKTSGDTPLRCGISAFGLSGTNAHIVLEEAPKSHCLPQSGRRQPVQQEARIEILTLAANSERALCRLSEKLASYLRQHWELPVTDVCYTMNLGRTQGGFRAAVVLEPGDRITKKLDLLIAAYGDEKRLKQEKIYQGYFKQIADGEKLRNPWEKSSQELMELGQQAKLRLRDFCGTRNELMELASWYIQGAEVDWSILYRKVSAQRIPLPTYPFEQKKSWFTNLIHKPFENQRLFYKMAWFRMEDTWFSKDTASRIAVMYTKGQTYPREVVDKLREKNCSVLSYYLAKKEDYISAGIQLGHAEIDKLVFLGMESKEEECNIEKFQQTIFLNLYNFIQIFLKERDSSTVEFVAAGKNVAEITGKESSLHPQLSTIFGLGRSIVKEYEFLRCKCIDFDEKTSAEQLCKVILSNYSGYEIGLREGKQYSKRLEFAEPLTDKKNAVIPQGTCVITGGLGGIGLALAKHLSTQQKYNLVLLNRSAFPEKINWQKILAAEPESIMSQKIRILQEIEAGGSVAAIYSVDITDKKKLKNLLEEIRRKFGRIAGVIHCAGVGSGGLIAEKTEKEIEATLAPKLSGTLNLDELTRMDRPDYFVLCSSVTTVFPGAALSDYTAANTFLDAYCDYRRKSGLPTLTINWATWKETGMAVDSGFTTDTIFKLLPTKPAVLGFDTLLKSSEGRFLAGCLNEKAQGLIKGAGVPLDDSVIRFLGTYVDKKAGPRPDIQKNLGIEQSVQDKNSSVQQNITNICREIMGINEIDLYSNFFELGADSLTLKKIHKEVNGLYPESIQITDLFQNTSIDRLTRFLENKMPKKKETGESSKQKVKDIAIIGIGLNFPNASTIEKYWEVLQGGCDCISRPTGKRLKDIEAYLNFMQISQNEVELMAGSYLEHVDQFDHTFFRIPPSEAQIMAPEQRLFLCTAYEAIEDAGYASGIGGSNTGLYLGMTSHFTDSYARILYDVKQDALASSITANNLAVTAGRVSYLLDLKGPSMVIDTACSSSLVAVDLACEALWAGHCTMAIAGGIKLRLIPVLSKTGQAGMGIESVDGITRAFDEESKGTGFGEGVSAVLLKPLEQAIEDHDNIYAIIKGSACNQDGNTVGLTAPNPVSQQELLTKVWEDAGIDPATITCFEAHGTGTPLGDPIEVQAITNAFAERTHKKQFCAISSVKTNYGHMLEAAGLAGLIKSVLALYYKTLPGGIHFEYPNRNINFADSPVYVNQKFRPWPAGKEKRRCGVSAFGMSGTNCHILLEEAPCNTIDQDIQVSTPEAYIFTITAKSEGALAGLVRRYCQEEDRLGHLPLRDLCYTASAGRQHYPWRIAIPVSNAQELFKRLLIVNEQGLGLQEEWFFFGRHKIVAKQLGGFKEYELTQEEQRGLTEQVIPIIAQITSARKPDKEKFGLLCQLYVRGADVKWKDWYGANARIVRLPGYSFQPTRNWIEIPAIRKKEKQVNRFYQIKWVARNSDVSKIHKADFYIILMDDTPFGRQLSDYLRQQGKCAVEVFQGESFQKTSDNQYIVGQKEEDYSLLLQTLCSSDEAVNIVHCAGMNPVNDWAQLNDTLDKSVYVLLQMLKACAAYRGGVSFQLMLIGNLVNQVTGAEPYLNPAAASLMGMGRVVSQENSRISCRFIDIEEKTPVELIAAELECGENLYLCAYRWGQRFVECFDEAELAEFRETPITFTTDGVYLITGGTGGIGHEIAKELAKQVKNPNIAIIGRTVLPEKEKWEAVDNQAGEKVRASLNNLCEICKAGAKVSYYAANVENRSVMEKIINEINREYGRIRGIIHCAGLPGDKMMIRKTKREFGAIMDVKVKGAWILDELTQDQNLDFFLMCSSISGTFAFAGQGDYAAGNSFLDAFACYRTKQGKKTIAVDWVTWKETGMGAANGLSTDGVFPALPTKAALESLFRVLSLDCPRITIGEFNPQADEIHEFTNYPVLLSSKLLKSIEQEEKEGGNIHTEEKEEKERVILTGSRTGQYTKTEETVAQMFYKVLGCSELNIHDTFFELGGDSVLLGRLHVQLEKKYPGKVSMVDLFEYNTIHKLSGQLGDKNSDSYQLQKQDTANEDILKIIDEMQEGTMSIEDAMKSVSHVTQKKGGR